MQLSRLLLCMLLSIADAKRPSNAILLSTVKTLTFRGDQLTTARRVKAIPQLKCIGGNAKGLYDVDVMRCKNAGSEYGTEDIAWTCQASLPSDFKLGSTDVICEGYDNSDDPYVLKGSCGVEYRLLLTPEGEQKFGGRGQKQKTYSNDEPSTLYTIFFWLVFLGIIGFFLYKIFIEGTGFNRPLNRGFRPGWGGGGGGPGGNDDPPPPYSRRAPRPYNTQPKQSQSSSQQGWRPGFFSGAAAGAAAGYAMGSRGTTRQQPPQAGPSNWFSGGSSTQSSTSPSSSSPSTTRHESTGFGSTRRR